MMSAKIIAVHILSFELNLVFQLMSNLSIDSAQKRHFMYYNSTELIFLVPNSVSILSNRTKITDRHLTQLLMKRVTLNPVSRISKLCAKEVPSVIPITSL
jgi:hypothetical protein